MANNYSEILKIVNQGNKMGLSNTITRDNGIPLDLSSVQPSYEAAVIYAATKSIAYIGQPIAVGDKLYIISGTAAEEKFVAADEQEYDNYLVEVGSKTEGDGATIDLVDGVLMLHGIDLETTTAGMLPQIEVVDGQKRIKWVTISQIVQGDGNKVTTLTSEDGSVVITKKEDTDASLAYDLSVVHPAAPEYAIAKDERAESATETKYHLTKDGEKVDVEIVVPDAYDDTALAGRVKALEDEERYDETPLANRVTALEQAGYQTADDVAGILVPYATTDYVDTEVAKKADKSAYDQTVLDLEALKARVEAFLDNTGAATEAIDTLQDLITYIDTHDDADISGILASIQALENKLVLGTREVNGEQKEYETVKAYVEAVIEALNVAQYAKATDLEGVAGRVATLEAKPFDTYATKTEVSEARTGAVADVAAVGYALATEVEETYATKQSVTDLGSAVDTKLVDYAKKSEVESVYATKEALEEHAEAAEGAYAKKTDVYTSKEVDELIAQINEGNQESAGAVSTRLESYITANDKEVANLKAADAAHDTAIAAAQAQADKGVADAKTANDAIAALTSGAIKTNTDDISAIKGRFTTLETAKGDHETRIGVVEGKMTALEAEDVEINKTLGTIAGQITALQGEDARIDGVLAAKADASAVYTKTEADNAIAAAIAAIPEVDLKDYAKTADIAKDYATKAELTAEAERADAAEKANASAIAAIYKAGEGEAVATGVLAEEIARAQAAEKKIADDLALLIENPTEALDSVKELISHVQANGTAVEGIIKRLDGHDTLLAGIGGEEEPATVVAAIAAAKQEAIDEAVAAVPTYELPAATASALGGIKASDSFGINIDGTVNSVSTDLLTQGVEELILFGGNAGVGA
jgi:hypothetical protein